MKSPHCKMIIVTPLLMVKLRLIYVLELIIVTKKIKYTPPFYYHRVTYSYL